MNTLVNHNDQYIDNCQKTLSAVAALNKLGVTVTAVALDEKSPRITVALHPVLYRRGIAVDTEGHRPGGKIMSSEVKGVRVVWTEPPGFRERLDSHKHAAARRRT